MIVRNSIKIRIYKNRTFFREILENVRGVPGTPWLIPIIPTQEVYFKSDSHGVGIYRLSLDKLDSVVESVQKVIHINVQGPIKDTDISNFCAPTAASDYLITIDKLGVLKAISLKDFGLLTEYQLPTSPNHDELIGFRSIALQSIDSEKYAVVRQFNGSRKLMDIWLVSIPALDVQCRVDRDQSLSVCEFVENQDHAYLVTASEEWITVEIVKAKHQLEPKHKIRCDSISIHEFGRFKGRSINGTVYLFNHFVYSKRHAQEANGAGEKDNYSMTNYMGNTQLSMIETNMTQSKRTNASPSSVKSKEGCSLI